MSAASRDTAWFRRTVQQLGDALAALSPERRALAERTLTTPEESTHTTSLRSPTGRAVNISPTCNPDDRTAAPDTRHAVKPNSQNR